MNVRVMKIVDAWLSENYTAVELVVKFCEKLRVCFLL